MLVDGRVKKALKFDDINSLVSFRDWLKNNLALYEEDQKIDNNHLKTFLNHIQEEIAHLNPKVKKDWLDKIKELLERLEDGSKGNK